MAEKRYDKALNNGPYPGLLRRRLSAPEIIMRKHSLARQRSDSFESDTTRNSTPSTLQPLYARSIWGRISNTGSDSNLSYKRVPLVRTSSQTDSIRRSTLLRCMRTRSRETELSSSTGHIDGSRKTTRDADFFTDSLVPQKNFDKIPTTPSTSDSKNYLTSSSAGMKSDNLSNYSESKSELLDSTYTKSPRGSTSGSGNSTFFSSSSDIHTPNTNSSETDNRNNNIKDPGEDSAYIHSMTNTSESAKINSDFENNKSDITIDLEVNKDCVNVVSNLNVNATTVNLIMHSDSDKGIVTSMPNKMASESNLTSFYLKSKDDVQITPGHCRLIKYMISNIRAGSIYAKPFGETPVVPRYSAMPRTTSMEVNPSSPDSTDKESDSASLVDSLDDPQSPRQSALLPKIKYDDKPVRGDLSVLLPDNSISCRETPVKRKIPKPAAFFIPIISEDDTEKINKPVSERMPDKVREKLNKRKEIIDQKKHQLDSFYHDSRDDNGNTLTIINQHKYKNETWSSTPKRKPKIDNRSKIATPKHINKIQDINSNTYPLRKTRKNNKNNRRRFNDENIETSSNLRHSSNSLAKNQEPFIEILENSRNRGNVPKKIEILGVTEETSGGHLYHHNLSKSKIPIPVHHRQNEYDRFLSNRTQYCPFSLLQSPDDDPKVDQLIANLLIDTLNSPNEEIHIEHSSPKKIEEKRPNYIISTKQNTNWYKQKFEMIPEEKTLSSSNENVNQGLSISRSESDSIVKSVEAETQVEDLEFKEDKNIVERFLIDASSQTDVDNSSTDNVNNNDGECGNSDISVNKGKAALVTDQNDDSSIPQGWITFYMLRKNPGSSSSTDEGGVKFTKTPKKAEVEKEKEVKSVVAKRKLGFQNNAIQNDDTSNLIVKREPNVIESSDGVEMVRKDQFTSSSDCKSQILTSDHESEKQSICPSLPLSSYLPLRKNRRLNQRRNRLKITQTSWQNISEVPGEWSVTVSGVNSCGQAAPDVEMRLKFPSGGAGGAATAAAASQSDSGFAEERPVRSRRAAPQPPNTTTNGDHGLLLPPAPQPRRKYTVITKKDDFLDKDLLKNKSFHYLPDLINNKNQRIISKTDRVGVGERVSALAGGDVEAAQSAATVRMPPLRATGAASCRPRQTLTSYRRFSLRHSTHLPPHLRLLHSINNLQPRDIVELPECFTNHLSVMGSSISSDMKPRLTLPKQDVNKNYFEQYQI